MELTKFEHFIMKNHPDPDSITIMEQEFKEPEWPNQNAELILKRIGLEWDSVIKLAEDYKEEEIKELKKAFGVSFDQTSQLIEENEKIKSACPNCKETIEHCACMRNKCNKCGEPIGNITFTICDDCWDKHFGK